MERDPLGLHRVLLLAPDLEFNLAWPKLAIKAEKDPQLLYPIKCGETACTYSTSSKPHFLTKTGSLCHYVTPGGHGMPPLSPLDGFPHVAAMWSVEDSEEAYKFALNLRRNVAVSRAPSPPTHPALTRANESRRRFPN
jgi:hypothetical protein